MGPRLTVLREIEKLKEKNDSLNHRECSASTVTETSELNQSLDQSCDNNDNITTDESSHQSNVQVTAETPVIIYENDDFLKLLLKPRFEDFDLKTLLLTSPLGKSILNYYKINNKLDNIRRNRLVSIIVKHLYNHIVKNRLQQDEYNSLAAKIVLLFPTEPMGVYYCPPVKKACSPFHKPVMAKGKLVNHCRNILFRSGDTQKQRKRAHEDEDEESFGIVPKQKEDNLEDTFKEEIAWLQHNTEPWNKVMEYWTRTWEVRSTSCDMSPSVSQYLEK
ncbi:uncharacterized protein LOC115888271 [Sitophilus oryzae]|uniref:Uncharacterized protein LOC115888271 n=1 Tax=Sitophilus oryzae TaxID=7048 RepID=A0A6J2YIE4_SITOR|nr:uncharacterized protein LOC115888271 [Sitophilus oryzae]